MGISYLSAAILHAILLNAQSSLASSAGTANGTIPAPVIIPASQYWEGNDGPWSSFQLRVGTPAQYPRVLMSTAAFSTWVVLPQAGCDVGCADSRGTLFNPNQSTSWRDLGLYALDLETNLDYHTNGDYGLGKVGLGLQETLGPTLDSQVVAGFQNNAYYYLGMLGLAPFPTNVTFNEPRPSFLATLKTKDLIPSLSWSYTAGAQYRLKQVLGSAILGGYDRSRFVPNGLSFSFAPDISRDLVVGLQSIKSVDNNGRITSLLPSGILTFVDSTIPYIWLPLEACSAFEKEFGLTWDSNSELYLVNDSLHNALAARKLNFTFQLGNLATGGPNVNITLPYASFALTASPPLVSNTTKYFPLKRAANNTQYTLGRAFLQEAYLIADYERSNFSISQCQWQEGLGQDIVAIHSINSTNTTTTTNPSLDSSSHLGAGAIAGIAVAGVLLLLLAGLITYAFAKRKWPFHRLRKPHAEAAGSGKDTDTISDKAEMDAHLSERVEMPSPYGGKEMPGCSPKYIPTTPVGELQGSPTPPPAAHEMMDPSIFQELPASPVPNDYFAGVKGSRQPSRQSPLRRHLSTNKGDKDSLPVSPLPSPVPSPPPPAATAESDLRYPKPTSSPVPRTPSKPQQRPFQLNLPHGSAPGSPVNANVRPVPSIAVHAPEVPEPPSENSTLQQTPIRMKWKPLDYSGEDYHRDRD